MYHAIVRRRVVDLFRAVSSGDAEPVLQTFAPRFEHTFLGESALGGTRRTLSATAAGTNGSIVCCPTSNSISRISW
jgi:ketosteroid isomerase-like protein